MICPICQNELNWECDYDFNEVGREGDGVCGVYHCPKCNVDVEIYTSNKDTLLCGTR